MQAFIKKQIHKIIAVLVFIVFCALAVFFLFLNNNTNDLSADNISVNYKIGSGKAPGIPENTKGTDGMKSVAKNGKIEMFLDEQFGFFAVKNNENGKVYYSNPTENPGLPKQTSNLFRSMLGLTVNYRGQIQNFNSFENSVLEGKYEIKQVQNGFEVVFLIGKKVEITSDNLPQIVEKSRFEKLILSKAEDADKAVLQKRYKLIDIKEITDSDERTELTKAYPALEKTPAYVLNRGLANYICEEIKGIFNKVGYTDEEIQADNSANGIHVTIAPPLKFEIKMTVLLEQEDLLVTVDCSKLYNYKDYPIQNISVLDYFGAANISQKDGFIFLPDGSGALIDFSKKHSNFYGANLQVYSDELSIIKSSQSNRANQVCMPVYGMKDGANGFLAIIEKGDEIANISANVSRNELTYYSVFSNYNISYISKVDAG